MREGSSTWKVMMKVNINHLRKRMMTHIRKIDLRKRGGDSTKKRSTRIASQIKWIKQSLSKWLQRICLKKITMSLRLKWSRNFTLTNNYHK